MQSKLNHLCSELMKASLRINISKTETMRVNSTNSTPFIINSQRIEDVNQFKYLGSVISTDGGALKDINVRLQKTKLAFAKLKNIWRASNIMLNTKIRIFNSCVKSVLLYGSETWFVSNEIERKVQAFVNRCLRNILKI